MEAVAALVGVLGVLLGALALARLVMTMRRRPATAGVTDATVEVASTAAHRTALTRGVRFATRLCISLPVGMLVVLLGAALALALTSPKADLAASLGIAGGIGATVALVLGGVGWWQVRALRADLREGAVLRTTGPVRVTTSRHGSFLDLVDRSFGVTYDVGHAATYADVHEVDHSPRGHFVFEMRDKSGAVVYRDKHYRPES